MGDYKDTRGAAVVAAGSGGKRKRILVDANDNGYLEDYYLYTDPAGARLSLRGVVGNAEPVSTTGTLSTTQLTTVVNSTSGAIVLTVPNGTYVGQRRFILHREGASSVTVTGASVASSYYIDDGALLILHWNGTNWFGNLMRSTSLIFFEGAQASALPHENIQWVQGGTGLAFNVANGTHEGQICRVVATQDQATCTVTATAMVGWSSVTMAREGDSVTLRWRQAKSGSPSWTAGWTVQAATGTVTFS